ncbi:MAG TPA: flagellar biosynthetic protein FliQ [Candidatus Acidoferrales bacterium]|jgi:flagellar biosynthetic protein FliQ|nr:flagellar biosynthetic protein FliQ [Candidatus Acidoferrales bacterium]
MDVLDGLLHDALLTTATIALPMLAVASLIGTVIAVLQAATQVQETTLTLLPKIVAVGFMAAVFGEPAMWLLEGLFARALAAIPLLVGGS